MSTVKVYQHETCKHVNATASRGGQWIGSLFDYGRNAVWCERFVACNRVGTVLLMTGSKRDAFRAIHANGGK